VVRSVDSTLLKCWIIRSQIKGILPYHIVLLYLLPVAFNFPIMRYRYKSNWLWHVTRMNINRMPKIMLNYRHDGPRRLWRS
jgi:hypothetical protein